MSVVKVREVCDGYAIDIKTSEESAEVISLFFNSQRNAETVKRVLEADEKEQTVDVAEVVHAYWEETTHITESKRGRTIHSKLYNCSNCGAPNGRKKSSYCHWCGARMDGERRKNEK